VVHQHSFSFPHTLTSCRLLNQKCGRTPGRTDVSRSRCHNSSCAMPLSSHHRHHQNPHINPLFPLLTLPRPSRFSAPLFLPHPPTHSNLIPQNNPPTKIMPSRPTPTPTDREAAKAHRTNTTTTTNPSRTRHRPQPQATEPITVSPEPTRPRPNGPTPVWPDIDDAVRTTKLAGEGEGRQGMGDNSRPMTPPPHTKPRPNGPTPAPEGYATGDLKRDLEK
jgi:hypothetical protein